jgi:hypothetical protein
MQYVTEVKAGSGAVRIRSKLLAKVAKPVHGNGNVCGVVANT